MRLFIQYETQIRQYERGGAVFARGTPKKCRAANIRAAPVGQLVLARSAIPRPDHIKAIIAKLLHPFFVFLSPAGIVDGSLDVFVCSSNEYRRGMRFT